MTKVCYDVHELKREAQSSKFKVQSTKRKSQSPKPGAAHQTLDLGFRPWTFLIRSCPLDLDPTIRGHRPDQCTARTEIDRQLFVNPALHSDREINTDVAIDGAGFEMSG